MKSSNVDRVRLPKTVLEAALDAWGQAGGQHLIPISGRSMLPTIHDGDHALVSHGCAGVRPGDVVVFRREGTLVAHRVMRIEDGDDGPIFVTKGDNVPRFDPHFSAGEIVGRVLAIERNGQYMSLDTAAWRLSGWLITVGTLVWARLYGYARDFKQRLFGSQPTRVIAILRRVMLAFFTQAFTLSQAITCRWKKSARAPSKKGSFR
jgi:signal peptidase I